MLYFKGLFKKYTLLVGPISKKPYFLIGDLKKATWSIDTIVKPITFTFNFKQMHGDGEMREQHEIRKILRLKWLQYLAVFLKVQLVYAIVSLNNGEKNPQNQEGLHDLLCNIVIGKK